MDSTKQGTLSAVWQSGNKRIKCKLSIIVFEDSGKQIVYCPAVDVYGYGATEQEATDSFQVCLDEFFRYTTNKGTLELELQQLGWTKSNSHKLAPPVFSSLIASNKVLNGIFNSRSFKKIDRTISIPACA